MALPSRPSARTTLSYALPAFALAAAGLPVYVFLPPFYADVVGVPVALIGLLGMAVRVLDAVSDPLVGAWSDRTRTRWGRRRPWMALGAPALALALLLLYAPPASLGPTAAAAWFGVGMALLFLCWTVVAVPYEALGPELATDHDARTGLLGARDGLLLLGTVAASAAPAIALAVLGEAAGERSRLAAVGAVQAALVVGLTWLAVALLREPAVAALRPPEAERSLVRRWQELRAALRDNRPFRVLLLAFTVSSFGAQLPATLVVFFVEHVLGETSAERWLLLYLGVGILFLPAWVPLSRRIGKRAAWLAAMAVNTGAFLGVLALGPGDGRAYAAICVISGLGMGGTIVLPSSMQADVIDYDQLQSGARREGRYVALWSMSRKLAAAAGIAVALPLLQLAGYQPGAAAQSPTTVLALKGLYGLVPCLCNLAAMAVAWRYPIDRAAHDRILAAIADRTAGRPWSDPLRSA